jgi:DNA-directed RNA polymerase specialized sigma24 family protein
MMSKARSAALPVSTPPLRALPRAQRAVIAQRHLEDLTELQTADVLGCSVGTVKSHSVRA